MSKSNFVLKRTVNAVLDLIAAENLPHARLSESELARVLDVSRTTVHAALNHLEGLGVVGRSGHRFVPLRPPRTGDYFGESEMMSPQEQIQEVLMELMRSGQWQSGSDFSETDLARCSGVSTASAREFLIGFSRFHIVEKRSRGGWRLLGLHVDFAREVAEMRHMIELEAIGRIDPRAPGCRQTVERLLARHKALLAQVPHRDRDFRALDNDFHLWLLSYLDNRFAMDFFDIVSFVFHYHYQWNQDEEQVHNVDALREHIDVLQALLDGNRPLATDRLTVHLTTCRTLLIHSLGASACGEKLEPVA